MPDLIIRNGIIIQPNQVIKADLVIEDGFIHDIVEGTTLKAKDEINAEGLHIFPGLIDTHVHFNEPGRTKWEGIASGSSALAAGGGSVFFDMPLNSDPPLLKDEDFKAKLDAATASSVTDFAFWGGLTPDNLEHLEDLAELGVIGFKAFMSNSGIPEFKATDDLSLYRGMLKAAQLGLPVALHAESEAITGRLTNEARSLGLIDIEAYLNSRPVIAELEAINRALLFAQETGCDLHIVHVSSARGLALIADARMLGQSVSSETCAHYLHLTDQDVVRLGAIAKCAPPLRSDNERHALWQALLRGEVDMIASDHSPGHPDLKDKNDFFNVWGGISGVQSSLNVLFTHRQEQGLSLTKIAELIASKAAERFRLAHKGRLEPNYEADLSLVNVDESFQLNAEDLFYKHKLSPYVGETFRGTIKQTLLRGKTLFKEGKMTAEKAGKLLKPFIF